MQNAQWIVNASGGTQLNEMDINGDGGIEPSEFYAFCRKKLCANVSTFNAALSLHQVLVLTLAVLALHSLPSVCALLALIVLALY